MVALHAWRSRASIAAFHQRYAERPLVVALTGTDVYGSLHDAPEPTLASMRVADRLVGLHDRVGEALPPEVRPKLRIIVQSAPALSRRMPSDAFDVLVVAHLRDVKDPLRAALAVRSLPDLSRLRVTLLGDALTEGWAEQARAEAKQNPRFHWLGGVGADVVREWMAAARVLVVSSVAEGGANVVSEAIAARLPVVASAIPGNLGLLGADWPATFPVGDTAALRDGLLRLEAEPDAWRALERATEALAPRFTAARERAAWARLLGELA